jgi:3-dehydroquinate dehydratase-2
MTAILVLNGPNLNLLGERQPEVYGSLSMDEINQRLVEAGEELEMEIRAFQSNSEGALIDALHEARTWADGVIFNPGAYMYSSLALHDAVKSISIPVIEVHISNVYTREKIRHHSMISAACSGKIVGLGWRSYLLGLHALKWMLSES